jgi:hypothetical protein
VEIKIISYEKDKVKAKELESRELTKMHIRLKTIIKQFIAEFY